MRTRWLLPLLTTIATTAGGCATTSPTDDALVITTRSPDAAEHYDVHLFAWEKTQLTPRWTQRVGPVSSPPRALARSGVGDALIVEVRERADGRARLRRIGTGAALDDIAFDSVLDANGSTLLLSRRLQRTPRPVLRVSRGEIRTIDPPWVHLTTVNIDTGQAHDALPQPVLPVARLAPLLWLVLSSGEPAMLLTLNAQTGAVSNAAPWSADRHIASAVVTPNGRRVILAVQQVGARWNLFDLMCWERDSSQLRPLIVGVFSANRANANVSPALPMYAINDRHLAFVLTEVSEWRGKLPVEGQYHTAIADCQTGEVLVRIRNPQRSLRNEVPSPYLPDGRLVALRIDRTNRAAPGNGSNDEDNGTGDRWQPFFTFRNGRLVDAAGENFEPQALGPYAYSGAGNVLAVRERSVQHDRCLIYAGRGRLPPIELREIERLTWLRPAKPPATFSPAP